MFPLQVNFKEKTTLGMVFYRYLAHAWDRGDGSPSVFLFNRHLGLILFLFPLTPVPGVFNKFRR